MFAWKTTSWSFDVPYWWSAHRTTPAILCYTYQKNDTSRFYELSILLFGFGHIWLARRNDRFLRKFYACVYYRQIGWRREGIKLHGSKLMFVENDEEQGRTRSCCCCCTNNLLGDQWAVCILRAQSLTNDVEKDGFEEFFFQNILMNFCVRRDGMNR